MDNEDYRELYFEFLTDLESMIQFKYSEKEIIDRIRREYERARSGVYEASQKEVASGV